MFNMEKSSQNNYEIVFLSDLVNKSQHKMQMNLLIIFAIAFDSNYFINKFFNINLCLIFNVLNCSGNYFHTFDTRVTA